MMLLTCHIISELIYFLSILTNKWKIKCLLFDLPRRFHGLLVLLGETCEHLGLEATRECDERQEAEDEQCKLPAEVEGHDDGHTDVGQRVDNHTDLGACSLWRNGKVLVSQTLFHT